MAGFVNHFRGTARFYAACRPGYPDSVWELLEREAKLDPSSRVLDLGCGPGTAALPLAKRVASVTAVDADAEMLEEGRTTAAAAGIHNIHWVQATAEDFVDEPGTYQLIVIASAFHWMNRDLVAAKCHTWLRPSGVLAVIGNPTPLAQIRLREGVGAAIADVQERWLGRDPFPLDTNTLPRPEEILQASPFEETSTKRVPCEQEWDSQRLVGFLRSTSSRPDERLGRLLPQFAEDLDAAVRNVEPSGQWKLKGSVEVILARR